MKEPTVPCRLPQSLWRRIALLAVAERRSGLAQLAIVVERGLDGAAGYELGRLAAERSSALMEKVAASENS